MDLYLDKSKESIYWWPPALAYATSTNSNGCNSGRTNWADANQPLKHLGHARGSLSGTRTPWTYSPSSKRPKMVDHMWLLVMYIAYNWAVINVLNWLSFHAKLRPWTKRHLWGRPFMRSIVLHGRTSPIIAREAYMQGEPVLVFHDATVVAHQCRSFQGFPSKISNPSYMVYSSLLIITWCMLGRSTY